MAIAIVGTPATKGVNSFVSNTQTLDVTVPSGAQVLIFGATCNDFDWSKLSSVTVGGSSTGLVVAATTVAGGAGRSVRWWYLLAPTAGTQTIAWNYTTSSNNAGSLIGLCLTGVDTASLIADAQISSNGTATSPFSTNVTSPSGAVAFSGYHVTVAGTAVDGSQTVLFDETASGRGYSYKLNAAAMSVTFTGTQQAAQAVIVVRAAAAGDTTAPVLSSPTGTATGSTTATVGATTDEGNGIMYAVVTTSATQPSVAQIKAGQNNAGTAATWSGSQSITTTGAKTFSATGLTASTAYFAHVVHADAAANDSNRVTSSSFTTSAVATGVLATSATRLGAWAGSGAGLTFAYDSGVSYRAEIYADGATLGSPVLSVAPATTLSGGLYPSNISSVSLTTGVTYKVVFTNQATSESSAPVRMVAA